MIHGIKLTGEEEKAVACLLAPAAEAIVVTVLHKAIKKREERVGHKPGEGELLWSEKLSWLRTLLWGGVFLLTIEHIWHGEVVLYPPFLTALATPGDIAPMLHEIATVGGCMSLLVTGVWGVMVWAAGRMRRKAFALQPAAQED